eukprot:TRINITY_DN2043_c0_g1_i5.p1 TRINITY_DN2043_c0_g1~~TRINITY_DN2043_c0_g1_i5.p1  ORF type:complete len:320 (+),score=38.62 TRINITY_DN2043_c0_g1_i5:559-1518(+)
MVFGLDRQLLLSLLLLICLSVCAQYPSPPPPSFALERELEASAVNASLASRINQYTTAQLLFNTSVSSVGLTLASQTHATLLAPQDDAWQNLAAQDGGAKVKELLDGKYGKLVLANLLKYHIVTEYLLYIDLQLLPDNEALPTLLSNSSVFLRQLNGQNVFFASNTSERGDPDGAVSNDPDISQDGVISIQGITSVLIPPLGLLLPSPPPPRPAFAPAPSPALAPSGGYDATATGPATGPVALPYSTIINASSATGFNASLYTSGARSGRQPAEDEILWYLLYFKIRRWLAHRRLGVLRWRPESDALRSYDWVVRFEVC